MFGTGIRQLYEMEGTSGVKANAAVAGRSATMSSVSVRPTAGPPTATQNYITPSRPFRTSATDSRIQTAGSLGSEP
jgi:hypothetical protein